MNPVCVRRDSFVRTAAVVGAVGVVVAMSSGCRTGSWVTKPSWMTFGQKPADADALAAAGDVPKPSATAKPYPTTSTPESYALPEATAQAATAPGAAPAAVTYGATPPPSAPAALAATPPPGAAASAPPTPGAIAPQVGPYAASAAAPGVPAAAGGTTASGWTSPELVAVPPAADPAPATVSTAPPPWAASPAPPTPDAAPAQRYADSRAASPAWTPPPLDPPPADDGRYATGGTSRFSGLGAAPAAASLVPATVPAPLEPAVTSPPAPLQQAPTAVPAGAPSPSPGFPSSPAAPSAPGAPARRPDPGYRPGGTSSYRPARTSLAGDAPATVQAASFQSGPATAP